MQQLLAVQQAINAGNKAAGSAGTDNRAGTAESTNSANTGHSTDGNDPVNKD